MQEENKDIIIVLKRFFGSLKEDSSPESVKRASGRALASIKNIEERTRKQF